MIFGEFLWRFSVDSGKLVQGLDAANKAADSTRSKMDQLQADTQNVFSRINKGFDTLRNAAIVTGAVMAFNFVKNAVIGVADELDRLNDIAGRTGASAANIEAFGKAAVQAGSSKEAVEGLLLRISDEMGRGGEALEDIGVAILKTDGSMRDVFDVASDMSDALSKMGPQAAGAFMRSLRVTDKSLINMMTQGSEVLNNQILAQRRSESDMDARQKSAGRFLTAWRKFQAETVEGKAGQLFMDTAATIVEGINELLKVTADGVETFIDGARQIAANVIIQVNDFIDYIDGVFPGLWDSFGKAFTFVWNNITNTIKTGLGAAFDLATGNISGAWGKVKSLFTGEGSSKYGEDSAPPEIVQVAKMANNDGLAWAKKVQNETTNNSLNNVNNVNNQTVTDNSRKQSTSTVTNRNNTTINIDARGADPKATQKAVKDGVLDADRIRLQQQTGIVY